MLTHHSACENFLDERGQNRLLAYQSGIPNRPTSERTSPHASSKGMNAVACRSIWSS